MNEEIIKAIEQSEWLKEHDAEVIAKGFDLGVRKVMEVLHEHDAIFCIECPMYRECNDDCEIVMMRYLQKGNKNE